MELRCSHCGQNIYDRQKACPHCGSATHIDDEAGNGWRPVSLPEGLVDEGIGAAKSDVLDDNQQRASVQLNGGARLVNTLQSQSETQAAALPIKQIKLIGITIATLLIVGAIVFGVITNISNHQDYKYIGWPYAPMYEDTNLTLPVATLQRGEAVLYLGKEGSFAKIRDLDGKIGFVQQNHLVDSPPTYIKDAEFYGCKQYLSEDSGKPCQERATKQFKACSSYCSSDISGLCQAKCQEQMVSCHAKCGR